MGELVAARRRQGLPERPSPEQLADVGRILGEARKAETAGEKRAAVPADPQPVPASQPDAA